MSNKKYYWLKLKENFFTDKTIKKLRKIAGGDTYTIIYLKLLLKATETDGKLYFDGVEDTFADEIALDIDEDTENVKVTLMYLIKCGLLVEVSDYEMELTRINEMIGSETNKAELMRKKRARDKKLHEQKVTMLPDVTETVTMLPDVTKVLPYIEKEKEKEIEKEKDKEIEKREKKKTMDSKESPSSSSSKQVDEFISLYHDVCKSLPKIRVVTDTRKKAIKTLLSKISLEEIKEAFEIIEKTPFLKGDNDRGWKPNIEFLAKHDNIVKILEGFYDFKPQKTNSYQEQRVTINGKEYIMKNGKYYVPRGSGIPVNPYAEDDLPF